ncbi:XAC2610-related protein [Croceimicrobium sp.]|uniref:XAC2610-related protein n=1 Tax=Croceimicrobium sp. TaxID=2828340 RepID=UPI003BAC38BD
MLLILLALILYNWESSPVQGSKETKEVAQKVSEPLIKEEKESDTLIFSLESILGVSNYDVRLIQIDSNFVSEDIPNQRLELVHQGNATLQVIYSDLIHSDFEKVEFKDFNSDYIPDLLIQCASDVRSNWTYNLYLIEKDGPSLKKIEGFNEIKNPDWDYETGLIRSYVVSGQDYEELYRINRNDSVERFEWVIPTSPNTTE